LRELMRVLGIGWLGTRTDRFAEMTRFATEVLGLTPAVDEPDVAVYRLVDGDEFEIFGPDNDDLPYDEYPIVAFLVEDVEAARAEMEAKGVEFLGPTEWHNGSAWAYFRAPDGNVYELTHRPTSEGMNA
jgi:catechol 2,3-dioxygenase-like lactoylglutathione lyase family enzyme